MLEPATLALLIASFAHLFVQVYNRFLLCIADGPWKQPIHIAWGLVSFVIPSALLMIFRNDPTVRRILRWESPGAMDIPFLLATILVVFLLTRVVVWLLERYLSEPIQQIRSEYVAVPSLPPVPSMLPRIIRTVDTTGDLQVVHREISLAGLAPAFDGFRVVQVADVHFGQRLEMENYLFALHDLVNGMHADVVVLTGDFVDRKKDIVRSVEYHAQFRGRLGTLCVLGNHDYWTRPQRIIEELQRTHVRWLGGGERRVLKRAGRRLIFAGTDAPWNGQRPDLERLIRRGTGDAAVLLSHTPDNAGEAARAGASLTLSGHNHGGQMCLPFVGPVIVPSRHGLRYAGGLYRVGGNSLLNVSRGIGVSSGGLRILCPPEITVLTLRAPQIDVMIGRALPASSELAPVASTGY
jgi:hypothetical protein